MSSKFTTSLALLLILVVGLTSIAMPAAAQRSVTLVITYPPALTPPTVSRDGFGIQHNVDVTFESLGARVVLPNGIVAIDSGTLGVIPPASGDRRNDALVDGSSGDLGNLEELLRFGGTIELAVRFGNVDAEDLTLENIRHRFGITEIMWGLDLAATGAEQANKQWIEIYNNHSSAPAETLSTSGYAIVLTENVRKDRIGKPINVISGQNNADDFDPDVHDEGNKFYVVDSVSLINRFGHRWEPPGGSGRTTVGSNGEPITNLVSMYRKRELNETRAQYKSDKSFGDGSEADSWAASVGRINMDGPYIGTPGAVHLPFGGLATREQIPASLPATGLIINEIRDDTSPADLDWIELHNTSAAAINIRNWSFGVFCGYFCDFYYDFPDTDITVPAGGYLVVYNRHPSETVLAAGVNVADYDGNDFPTGATHLYYVMDEEPLDDNFTYPALSVTANSGSQFLIALMHPSRNEAGQIITTAERVADIAGNMFAEDRNVSDIWPLEGWTKPTGANLSPLFTEAEALNFAGHTWARKGSRPERFHKDDWEKVGYKGGLGYDPGTDPALAPGTPGYANNAVKEKPTDITGEIVISEIMYDAGPNGNLAQWIELYNSSMTEAANLKDWEFEIRNIDTDVEAYVDAKFKFDGDAIILPNQTVLLVSDRSSASDVVANRVYNLYQKHRNALGLSARKSVLLSSEGFHLELRDKDGNTVDDAGNVMLDGPRRTVMWELHETGGDMRFSIIRGFGTRATYDGNRGIAHDGTLASSWHMAQSVGSYYGHRDDVGSPGHREGSPLPVSLSSFRPVRDKATGEVVIRWSTESELNNAGFNILRSETKESEFKVINVKGLIAGHGTTSEKHVYTYTDTTAKPNVVYYYQIEDVSLDGKRTTLATTHLRGNVTATGKVTTTWADLKAGD